MESVKNNINNSHKSLQASNYAQEWIELTKWYIDTVVVKDRINWWDDSIKDLSWDFTIKFNNWYVLEHWSDQIIEEDNENYYYDFLRKIKIENWISWDEKVITSEVYYNSEDSVSYQVSIINRYGR